MKIRKFGLVLFITGSLLIYSYLLPAPYNTKLSKMVPVVSNQTIEIVQQNPGPAAPYPETVSTTHIGSKYNIESSLGRLGKRSMLEPKKDFIVENLYVT